MELENLKKNYEKIAKNHKLPSFSELNADFEIEKLERESDNLLRSVRKIMMEKIVNSMGFLDMLINPVNAPRMYLPYIQTMTNGDRKDLDSVYSSLGDLIIHSLDLEVDSTNENEAKLIKEIFVKWGELKGKFRQILDSIKKPRNFVKKERSYFG